MKECEVAEFARARCQGLPSAMEDAFLLPCHQQCIGEEKAGFKAADNCIHGRRLLQSMSGKYMRAVCSISFSSAHGRLGPLAYARPSRHRYDSLLTAFLIRSVFSSSTYSINRISLLTPSFISSSLSWQISELCSFWLENLHPSSSLFARQPEKLQTMLASYLYNVPLHYKGEAKLSHTFFTGGSVLQCSH